MGRKYVGRFNIKKKYTIFFNDQRIQSGPNYFDIIFSIKLDFPDPNELFYRKKIIFNLLQ